MSAAELGNASKKQIVGGEAGSCSQKKGKSGLSSVTLAPNELSSKYGGKRNSEVKMSNIAVRLLRATNLLASDIDTGKSDPTGFAWIGDSIESPSKFEEKAYSSFWYLTSNNEKVAYEYKDSDQYELRRDIKMYDPHEEVKRSKTIKNTLSPNWNEDLVFKDIDMANFDSLFNLRCIIILRDEDLGSTGDISVYQDLGAASIPLRDIIIPNKESNTSSRITKTGVTFGPITIPLGPTSNIARHHGHRNIERGTLTVSVSMSFDEKDDNEKLMELRKSLSLSDEMIPIAELVTILKEHFAKKKEDATLDLNKTISSTLDRKRAEIESKQSAKTAKRATTPSKVTRASALSPRNKTSENSTKRYEESLETPIASDESNTPAAVGLNDEEKPPFSSESFQNMTRELEVLKERLKMTEAQVISGDQNIGDLIKLEHQLPTILENKPSAGKGGQEAESMMPEMLEGDSAENTPDEKVVSIDSTKEPSLTMTADAAIESDVSSLTVPKDDLLSNSPAPDTAEVKSVVEKGLSNKFTDIVPIEENLNTNKPKDDVIAEVLSAQGDGKGNNIVSGAKIGSDIEQTSSPKLTSPPLSDSVEAALEPVASNNTVGANPQTKPVNIENSLVANASKIIDTLNNETNSTTVREILVNNNTAISEKIPPVIAGPVPTPVSAKSAHPELLSSDASRGDEAGNLPQDVASNGSGSRVIDGALKDGDIMNSSGSATSAARALREMAQQRDLLQKHLEDLTSLTTQGILTLTKHIQQVEKKAESALRASNQSLNTSIKKPQLTANSIEEPEPTQGDDSTPEGAEDIHGKTSTSDIPINTSVKGRNLITAKSKTASKKQTTPSVLNASTPAADSTRAIAAKKASAELAALRKERKNQLLASADCGTVEIISKGRDGELVVMTEQLPQDKKKSFKRKIEQAASTNQSTPEGMLGDDLNIDDARGDEAGNYTDEDVDDAVEIAPVKIDRKGPTKSKSFQQEIWSQPQLWSPMGINWKSVEECLKNGDYRSCFTSVLDYGNLDDIVKLMELTGPKPEVLSVTIRNKIYENVCVLLVKGHEVERCLIWVLALIRGQDSGIAKGLVQLVARHTLRDLIESLEAASVEPSRRGLLASLLASQLEKSLNSTNHKISTNEFLTKSGNLNLSKLP